MMIKDSIQQKEIILVNKYAPKNETSKYVKQIVTGLKGDIDFNPIVVRSPNTPFSEMDRSSRHKNQTRNRTAKLHSNSIRLNISSNLSNQQLQNTFFSTTYGTFSRIHHMKDHQKKKNYWEFFQGKWNPSVKETFAPPCLLQHCSQVRKWKQPKWPSVNE